MNSNEVVDGFFAWAPWVLFAIALITLYVSTRNAASREAAPIGKTYACAQCGRRAKHEHMVPRSREGAVVWYCAHCAPGH